MALIHLHPLAYSKPFHHFAEQKAEPSDYTTACSEKELRIDVDVPGVKMSDIELTCEEEEGKIRMISTRRFMGSDGKVTKKARISKVFNVDPKTSNLAEVRASLADGVLTIVVPRKELVQPRKIMIKEGTTPAIEAEKVVETVDEAEVSKDKENTNTDKTESPMKGSSKDKMPK